jgi:hypothetical protein
LKSSGKRREEDTQEKRIEELEKENEQLKSQIVELKKVIHRLEGSNNSNK